MRTAGLALAGAVALAGLSTLGELPQSAQAAPPKRVFAFLSRADGLELTRLERFGRRISVVAPNWYDVDLASAAVHAPSARGPVLGAARRAGVPVWPVVNARTGGSAAVGDPVARRRAARAIARIAAERGHAGVTLDVEELLPSQRDAYTAFVRRVATLVHRRGGRLAVYAPRPSGVGSALAYDWPALAAAADLLLVSTYNEHGPNGPPGPLDSSAGFRAVLERAASVSRTRVAPIIGAIGYVWPTAGGRGEMLSTVEALRRGARRGAAPIVADGSASFSCGGSTTHYATGRGLRARARMAGAAGFRWLALFSLGREPRAFWQGLPDVRGS